jgi:hypothetical protein
LASGAAWAGSITVGSVINADTAVTAGTVTGGQSNDLAAAVAHTNRSDNPHVVTLQQSVNAGSGPVTNAPYLVQTNATDVTFAGWRIYLDTDDGYSVLRAAGVGGCVVSADDVVRLLWNENGTQFNNTNNQTAVCISDTFRVGPDSGTNLAVYAELTNHTAQIAGKLDTTGSGGSLTGLTVGQVAGAVNSSGGAATNLTVTLLTYTNGTTMGDGVLNGTNGVWFSPAGSTNRYWQLGGL